jgi:hypothetical protein
VEKIKAVGGVGVKCGIPAAWNSVNSIGTNNAAHTSLMGVNDHMHQVKQQ